MARKSARKSSAGAGNGSRESLYDQITNRIIAQLEEGRLPWVQPWKNGAGGGANVGMPHNAVSQRNYSGVNVLLLWGEVMLRGYENQTWLTYKQAQALGGQVRKGEKGTGIVFAGRFTPEAEKERATAHDDEARSIPFLRWYTVFNAAQCDGLPDDITPKARPIAAENIDPEVKAIIAATGVGFAIGGDMAFYSPARDQVQVPLPSAYYNPIDWHRTALHELGHATGHRSRLNRDLTGRFGSSAYAFEELIAEITAAYSCASLGIEPTVRHADYIGSWLEVLKSDNRAIIRAASQASKAADWILAHRPGSEDGADVGTPEEAEDEVTEMAEAA